MSQTKIDLTPRQQLSGKWCLPETFLSRNLKFSCKQLFVKIGLEVGMQRTSSEFLVIELCWCLRVLVAGQEDQVLVLVNVDHQRLVAPNDELVDAGVVVAKKRETEIKKSYVSVVVIWYTALTQHWQLGKDFDLSFIICCKRVMGWATWPE